MDNHINRNGKRHKCLMLALVLFGMVIPLAGQSTGANLYYLIIGTYTQPGKSEGIYVYDFDSKTGDFIYRSVASGVLNPSFLTISRDRKYIYAVNETGGGKGAVSSFSFDSKSGDLDFLNTIGSGGNGPCYIAIDKQSKYVYAGNYGGGSLCAIPVLEDGSLGSSIQSVRHQGHGITPNQQSSHVHATVPSGDDKFLYVTDLGTDKIHIYNLNLTEPNPISPASPAFVEVPAGSGPRHLTLHPNGKFAYAIYELTGQVAAFTLKEGSLETLQTVDMLPGLYRGNKYMADAADIHISPDGKFLYGSLRSDINEIVLFEIGSDGRLAYRDRYSTLGETPRNFAIDPTGNFLLVGNGGSDEIVIFKRNMENGELTPTGKKIKVGSPVCLMFVAKAKT